MANLVIGSRGSALALAQSRWIADRIKLHNPGVKISIEIIKTKGDKILDTPLAKIGDKGLFVKEIETALVDGQVDLAVHSMKDLPSESMDELTIAAVPPRVDPGDVLVSKLGCLSELPAGARIGSSSLRRRAQLLHHRPDLEFVDLRGNLDTRLRKLDLGEYDGIILAYAGLFRLGLSERVTEKIPFEVSLPAVGQGALAVQTRRDDLRIIEMLAPLDDVSSRAAVESERALLMALGGGCQTPIAALASAGADGLILDAMVASLDGSRVIRTRESGSMHEGVALGQKVAALLLESGAREILDTVTKDAVPNSFGAA